MDITPRITAFITGRLLQMRSCAGSASGKVGQTQHFVTMSIFWPSPEQNMRDTSITDIICNKHAGLTSIEPRRTRWLSMHKRSLVHSTPRLRIQPHNDDLRKRSEFAGPLMWLATTQSFPPRLRTLRQPPQQLSNATDNVPPHRRSRQDSRPKFDLPCL